MITEFQGEYRWLSNFAPVRIVINGMEYPTVEHAYMSAKSDDMDWKLFCADRENTAGTVKRKSRTITLRRDWEHIKLEVMEECLKQKFTQEWWKEKLLATGTEYIQEGNRWKDKFWGFCLKTDTGENRLGKMIMHIRDLLFIQEYVEEKAYHRGWENAEFMAAEKFGGDKTRETMDLFNFIKY